MNNTGQESSPGPLTIYAPLFKLLPLLWGALILGALILTALGLPVAAWAQEQGPVLSPVEGPVLSFTLPLGFGGVRDDWQKYQEDQQVGRRLIGGLEELGLTPANLPSLSFGYERSGRRGDMLTDWGSLVESADPNPVRFRPVVKEIAGTTHTYRLAAEYRLGPVRLSLGQTWESYDDANFIRENLYDPLGALDNVRLWRGKPSYGLSGTAFEAEGRPNPGNRPYHPLPAPQGTRPPVRSSFMGHWQQPLS